MESAVRFVRAVARLAWGGAFSPEMLLTGARATSPEKGPPTAPPSVGALPALAVWFIYLESTFPTIRLSGEIITVRVEAQSGAEGSTTKQVRWMWWIVSFQTTL